MIEKEKVLSDAPKALNSDNNPWEVAVEGDSIIGTWKWMDARFFTEGGISDEDKEFTFTVTLKDIGQDKKSGKVGIVESKLDTSIIKKSIRDYLKQCGWKKAGLFG